MTFLFHVYADGLRRFNGFGKLQLVIDPDGDQHVELMLTPVEWTSAFAKLRVAIVVDVFEANEDGAGYTLLGTFQGMFLGDPKTDLVKVGS